MKKAYIIAGVIFLILVVTSLQGLAKNAGPNRKGGQGCIKVKSADNEILGTLVDFTGQDNLSASIGSCVLRTSSYSNHNATLGKDFALKKVEKDGVSHLPIYR